MVALLVSVLLSQAKIAAPPKEPQVKVIRSNKSKVIAAKTQAELDAEARLEDQRLRCEEDPAACNAAKPDAKQLADREAALKKKEAELAEREEALKKKQEEEKDEKEKQAKAQAEQKKHLEGQSKQVQQLMQGLGGALAGEE